MTVSTDNSLSLKARKFTPTPEQTAAMDSTERSSNWFWQLSPEEICKYFNKTIAIYECEVVAMAPSRSELAPLIAHLDRSWVYVVSVPLRSRIRVQRP